VFGEKFLERFLGDSRNRNSLPVILQTYGKLDKNALLYKGLIKGFLPSIFCSRSLSVVFCSLSAVLSSSNSSSFRFSSWLVSNEIIEVISINIPRKVSVAYRWQVQERGVL
jgi:hypothetical protein